jgi:hypothetical protein
MPPRPVRGGIFNLWKGRAPLWDDDAALEGLLLGFAMILDGALLVFDAHPGERIGIAAARPRP